MDWSRRREVNIVTFHSRRGTALADLPNCSSCVLRPTSPNVCRNRSPKQQLLCAKGSLSPTSCIGLSMNPMAAGTVRFQQRGLSPKSKPPTKHLLACLLPAADRRVVVARVRRVSAQQISHDRNYLFINDISNFNPIPRAYATSLAIQRDIFVSFLGRLVFQMKHFRKRQAIPTYQTALHKIGMWRNNLL